MLEYQRSQVRRAGPLLWVTSTLKALSAAAPPSARRHSACDGKQVNLRSQRELGCVVRHAQPGHSVLAAAPSRDGPLPAQAPAPDAFSGPLLSLTHPIVATENPGRPSAKVGACDGTRSVVGGDPTWESAACCVVRHSSGVRRRASFVGQVSARHLKRKAGGEQGGACTKSTF